MGASHIDFGVSIETRMLVPIRSSLSTPSSTNVRPQKQPKLKLSNPPLLLLPLSFPPPSSRPLTSWATISLNLPTLIPHFSSAALTRNEGEEDEFSLPLHLDRQAQVPSGKYSHVSYVKVYATCRLRRVWFSEGGPQQRLPWELDLYAADPVQQDV